MLTIVVTNGEQEIYRQSVEALDLMAVIHAVNVIKAPPIPRRKRSDAGRKRELESAADGNPFDV